jgi:membrane associated rhomboid family serine protease
MAFLQSGQGREPFLKAPASVLALIGALVAAHAARGLMTAAASEHAISEYALIPLRYSPHVHDPGSLIDRAVPFVSYMFIHGDWTHLAINCLWLLAFGSVVGRRFGAVLFLIFFILCGVAAGAIYLALAWGSPSAVIGASGAISGLMAAGIRMMGPANVNAGPLRRSLLPILSPNVLAFSGLWVVTNLILGFSGVGLAGEVQAIAWQAHLGGYFVGLFLAGPFDLWAQRGGSDLRPAA